ncbi:MAG: hypothetical protein AAB309_00210, partial [Deltaproteobacteria bacterium]
MAGGAKRISPSGMDVKYKGVKAFSVIFVAFLFLFFLILNVKVTTKQGIDTVVTKRKIPLYLKGISFFARHYETQYLAKSITVLQNSPTKKIEAIFAWTLENIKRQPPDLPVVDDHQWHIIVRGYGAADQMNDVFSLLSVYNGFKSYYQLLKDREQRRHPFSFVFVEGRWVLFDVCHETYFLNEQSRWADLTELRLNRFRVVS